MSRKYLSGSPRSLFDLTLDVLVINLTTLKSKDFDYLKTWPSYIKNMIIKKFLNTRNNSSTNFTQILSTLLNNNTRYLDLPSHTTNEEIANLKQSPNLRKLMMSKHISNITSNVLINSLQELHCINVIVLPYCKEVNDDVIKCLADNCPDLETLDLVGCLGITDMGIISLSKCEKLLHLALSRTQVGDNGITAVVKGNSGNRLIELRINDCPNISNEATKAIIENCSNIQVLQITSNSGVDPEFFEEALNLRNLKQFTWIAAFNLCKLPNARGTKIFKINHPTKL